MDKLTTDAFREVWRGLSRTSDQHSAWLARITVSGSQNPDEDFVVTDLLRCVDASTAKEGAKTLVVRAIGEDWRAARTVAILAGSATCRQRN